MTERRDEYTGKQGDATRHGGDDEHGWAPDEKGTGATGSDQMAQQAGDRAFDGIDTQQSSKSTNPNAGEPGTAAEGQAPEGVGESISRRGEDVSKQQGEEREPEGTKTPEGDSGAAHGAAKRPVGSSDADESTGMDPQEPIDDESPTMPAGDQGG